MACTEVGLAGVLTMDTLVNSREQKMGNWGYFTILLNRTSHASQDNASKNAQNDGMHAEVSNGSWVVVTFPVGPGDPGRYASNPPCRKNESSELPRRRSWQNERRPLCLGFPTAHLVVSTTRTSHGRQTCRSTLALSGCCLCLSRLMKMARSTLNSLR